MATTTTEKASRSKKTAGQTGTTRSKSRPRSNVEIIRKEYDALRRRDVSAVLEHLDPKIDWCEPPGALPPPAGGGIHRGHDAVRKGVLDTLPEYWDDFRMEPELFLDAGDHVVVTGRFRCEAKETGRRVNAPCVQIWTLDAGRAVRMENHTDTAQFARALSA